jgi:hypothetical protein
VTTPPVHVIGSWYVEGPKVPPYYVIEVQAPAPPWAPVLRLVTHDADLYSDCLGVEGCPVAVVVSYDRVHGKNILTSVDIAGEEN